MNRGTKAMNRNYDKIMNLHGVEEIKQLVKKWDVLSGNISNTFSKSGIVLPDLFWVINSGVGRTKMLNLLAEYLYSKGNLIDFYGNQKYFEFLLNYCPKDQEFHEIQRLMETSKNAAGFRNEFRGIVCVDIDEWIEHYREKHFIAFLEMLASKSKDWLIVLCVQEYNEDKIRALYAHLSMYLRLERVNLKMPSSEELLEYVKQKLSEHELYISEKDQEKMFLTIEKLRTSEQFDGFKTLIMLCQDIVYEHFCEEDAVKGEISEKVMDKFTVDSDYVKKLLYTFEKKYQIGFEAGN